MSEKYPPGTKFIVYRNTYGAERTGEIVGEVEVVGGGDTVLILGKSEAKRTTRLPVSDVNRFSWDGGCFESIAAIIDAENRKIKGLELAIARQRSELSLCEDRIAALRQLEASTVLMGSGVPEAENAGCGK